jgi:hypothetical protein
MAGPLFDGELHSLGWGVESSQQTLYTIFRRIMNANMYSLDIIGQISNLSMDLHANDQNLEILMRFGEKKNKKTPIFNKSFTRQITQHAFIGIQKHTYVDCLNPSSNLIGLGQAHLLNYKVNTLDS